MVSEYDDGPIDQIFNEDVQRIRDKWKKANAFLTIKLHKSKRVFSIYTEGQSKEAFIIGLVASSMFDINFVDDTYKGEQD